MLQKLTLIHLLVFDSKNRSLLEQKNYIYLQISSGNELRAILRRLDILYSEIVHLLRSTTLVTRNHHNQGSPRLNYIYYMHILAKERGP